MPPTITLLRSDAEALASAGLAFAVMLRLRQTLIDRGQADPFPTASMRVDGGEPVLVTFDEEHLHEIEAAVRRLRRALGKSQAI